MAMLNEDVLGGYLMAGPPDAPGKARKRAWTLPIHVASRASKTELDLPVEELRADAVDGGDKELEGHSAFLEGMKPALTIAQMFGLFPVSKPSSARDVSFRWASFRVAWCIFIIVSSAIEATFAVIRMFETGVRYYSSVNAVFFVMMTITQVMFLRLSMQWKDLVQSWTRIESTVLQHYEAPFGLKTQLKVTTAVALSLGVVEHSLSIATTFMYVWPCYARGGFQLLFQGYFLTKYLKTFTIITYSLTKALAVLFVQITCVFLWNYIDLFISLISMGLSAQFRRINKALMAVEGQALTNEFWRKKRKAYNALSGLVQDIDAAIGPIVVMAFAVDLYFVCLQLLSMVNSSNSSTYHDAFFCFSMMYLLMRASFMSYMASNINQESKRPRDVLFSVPSDGFTIEAERFLTQVTTDNIAFSGCNFFSISRSLMLKVAGTIVTYVIVLVQFGDKSANPDIAQSNGTVSCTCEDIKVYNC